MVPFAHERQISKVPLSSLILFLTSVTRHACYAPSCEKSTLFTRFLGHACVHCYSWVVPPPPGAVVSSFYGGNNLVVWLRLYPHNFICQSRISTWTAGCCLVTRLIQWKSDIRDFKYCSLLLTYTKHILKVVRSWNFEWNVLYSALPLELAQFPHSLSQSYLTLKWLRGGS